MKDKFLPFTTALMGSLPRSKKLLYSKERKSKGLITDREYEEVLFQETKRMIELQESVGLDVITSGELYRESFTAYIAEKTSGVVMMNDEELMNNSTEEFRESYKKSLQKRDVKDSGIRHPIAVSKINTKSRLNDREIDIMQRVTKKPLKTTLPSPYLLTRTLWLTGTTDKAYSSREELGDDLCELITNEIEELIKSGVSVIQLDDPILTQIVFSSEEDQTFY